MKNDKQLYFNTTFSIFLILILMNTCGVKTVIHKAEKKQTQMLSSLNAELDSLSKLIITQEKMVEIIKETPAWKTLRIEEISDKERISINALEEKTQ